MKKKVIHLINGLGKGGAETMLYQILKYQTDITLDYRVISLGLSRYYEEKIQSLGIDIVELDIRKHPLKSIYRLKKLLKDSELLCCWMYASNLLGYIYGRKKTRQLIWCIRHSDLSRKYNSKKTLLINKICAWLSYKVDIVAYNGHRAMEVHTKFGYKPRRECVLENGLDLSDYYRDAEAGKSFREKIGIDNNVKVVLSVSKNHPIKDLPTFIKAYSIVKKNINDTVAVMCGFGVSVDDPKLTNLCRKYDLLLGKDVFLLGFLENVSEIMNCGDVYVLHSAGEAFPNTLIQAMACEIPVVSTDVGDVREIMQNDNFLVKVGDYTALADCIIDILRMDDASKELLIKKNRNIVKKQYCIDSVVKRYEELFI